MAFLKYEEKQLLLDCYFDIEWCDDVSDFRCVHCHRVAINHCVSSCKHLFCKTCSKLYKDAQQQVKCPKCQETITQTDDQDFNVEVKIHKLRILCPNKKYGCKYADQLRKIPLHLMNCVHTREAAHSVDHQVKVTSLNDIIKELREGIKKVNDKVDEKFNQLDQTEDNDKQLNALTVRTSNLDKKIEGMGLESKKYTEELQSTKSQLESINQRLQKNESLLQQTSSNVAEMRNKTISMTIEMAQQYDQVKEQEKQMGIAKSEMSTKFKALKTSQRALTERLTHMEKIAEETKLATQKNTEEFHSLKLTLESLNQRLQKNESLQLMSSEVKEMRNQMTLNIDKTEVLQHNKTEELNPLKNRHYEVPLKVLLNTNQSGNWIHETNPIVFTGYPYRMRVKFEKKDGESCIYMYLQFTDGDTVNQFSQINGITNVKYIISDQSNALNKKDIISERDLSFDDCFGNHEWIMGWALRPLPEAILAPPYFKDDCIRINILSEPPSIDRNFVSNNGILLWRVDNVTTKKEDCLYSDVYSRTFYTSPRGYRTRIRLLLDHSSSMSVEVNFLTGQHDAALNRNFSHMTTVTLINQNNPAKSLVKCKHRENVKRYMIKLDTSKLVKQTGFNDDLLFLKVVIEPLASK